MYGDNQDTTIKTIGFEFTGKAIEYFNIWIVNVALTIFTLGIYSAWAKVRTNQYFYSNTLLDNASFRYTANPVQILKGRIIAFIIFMAYYLSSAMNMTVGGISILVIMLLVPAFVVMSMAFRLRNSVYRNVRFNFKKDYMRSYYIFSIPVLIVGSYMFVAMLINLATDSGEDINPDAGIAMMVLVAIIMFMFPWWECMIARFKATHSCYGSAAFNFTASGKNFYAMYLKAYLIFVIAFSVVGGLFFAIAAGLKETSGDEIAVFLPFVMMVLILPVYLWMFAYIQAKRTNLIYNNLSVDGHQLKSGLKTGYMMYLYVTNTIGIMISLGLLMPWAKIRTLRYKASVTQLEMVGDLDQFVSTQVEQQSAMGEEIGEIFDMDIGF